MKGCQVAECKRAEHRTYDRLASGHHDPQTRHPLTALLAYATPVPDPGMETAITGDSEDDKFLLCGRAAGAVVASGDRDHLEVNCICVLCRALRPRPPLRRWRPFRLGHVGPQHGIHPCLIARPQVPEPA